jgi:hypothetical protein
VQFEQSHRFATASAVSHVVVFLALSACYIGARRVDDLPKGRSPNFCKFLFGQIKEYQQVARRKTWILRLLCFVSGLQAG